jgi:hypothetical protein
MPTSNATSNTPRTAFQIVLPFIVPSSSIEHRSEALFPDIHILRPECE